MQMGGPASIAAAVTAATLALFVLTVCPTVPFGDGGELIAAADCLGVAHPPGYPLYLALGWLALRVPLGEPALRMNLLSSVFSSAACGVLAWLVARLTRSRVAAAASALALAVSATFWWVAVVAEVYALHILLMLLLLAAAHVLGTADVARTRARALLAAAGALGLGLAHHPTIVLALPAALLLAWPGMKGLSWRVKSGAFLLAIVTPAILDLSLMVRARMAPPSNWGRPTTLDALWVHVSAAAYRHFDLGWAGLLRPAAWSSLGRLLLDEFTPALLPLSLLGLAVTAAGGRRAAAAAGALIAAGMLFGLRYAADDVEVFYLPLFVSLALAAGLGIGWLRGRAAPVARACGIVAAALIVLAPALAHGKARQLRGMTASADYGRDVMATVPTGGVLFVEVDDAFPLLYLKQVLSERPDLTVYDRNGVLFRDLVPELRLPARTGESGRAYRLRVEQTFIERELARPARREVWFLGWPGYEAAPAQRLEPVGLLYRICRATEPTADERPVWAGYHEESILRQARRTGNAFALAVAATYPLARGERALYRGDLAEARRRFEDATDLAGDSASIHNYIGTLFGRMGDYPRAIAAFERSLSIKPFSVRAWSNLAMAYELAGNAERARDARAALARLSSR